VIGPQQVNPSDVLARMIDNARLALTETHYAADPREQRRQHVVYTGRRRQYQRHGVAEFYAAVAA
jgi:hypothetical protein